jgi:hypothetical protein
VTEVRRAQIADAESIGRLLHDFNTDPTVAARASGGR